MGMATSGLRQVLRDLRSQKLRTFLTVFGIVWGTTAISLLLAFGQGMHKQMIKNSAGIGSGVVITFPSRTSVPYEGLGKGRAILVTDEDVELLRNRVFGIGSISPEFQDQFRLQNGRRVLAVDVGGVEPDFGEMRNIIPDAGGRFLNPIDHRDKRRVAFFGNEIAEQVFGEDSPVGRTIRLNGSPFLVVGVMKEKIQQSNYSGRDSGRVFIPSSTFKALTGQKWVDLFIFNAADVTRTEAVMDQVQSILAARHRFDPADREALMMWDTTEMAQFFDTFMLAFKLFLGIVGSLTLVVGGIGVSNIMNVVVEERTREIGIKMALGARPGTILAQFLAETLIITTAGGVVGLALSAAICAAVPSAGMTDFIGDPDLSLGVSVGTALLLGLIGVVAGYFPARSAAGMDPVVAMKT